MSIVQNIQIINIIIIKCPITKILPMLAIQQFSDCPKYRERHLLKQGSTNFSPKRSSHLQIRGPRRVT